MVSMTNGRHQTTIKRKNEDDLSTSTSINMNTSNGTNTIITGISSTYSHHRPNTTAVVYSPRNANSWTQCKTRLHTLLLQYNDITDGANNSSDPILDDIATISTQSMKRTVLDVPQSTRLQKADEIVSKMESNIQRITQQVQNVSTIVTSLQAQYDTLQTYFMTMQKEMEELQKQQLRHQDQIQQYQTIIEQCKNDIGTTEQSMKKSVPRLQQNISLYVAMTGIKWNYDNDTNSNTDEEDGKTSLSGEINIASKQVIRQFHIDITNKDSDPQRHKYNIAQKLWNMIDGHIATEIL